MSRRVIPAISYQDDLYFFKITEKITLHVFPVCLHSRRDADALILIESILSKQLKIHKFCHHVNLSEVVPWHENRWRKLEVSCEHPVKPRLWHPLPTFMPILACPFYDNCCAFINNRVEIIYYMNKKKILIGQLKHDLLSKQTNKWTEKTNFFFHWQCILSKQPPLLSLS